MRLTSFFAVMAVAFAGCATDPMPQVRQWYATGDYVLARDALAQQVANGGDDTHLYRAEKAILDLAVADPVAAVRELRAARDRYDELSGGDALGWFGSVLLDDRQLTYQGYDYEKVLLRALLALADLSAGGSDARAYALQVFETQQRLMQQFEDQDGEKPKLRYKLVAFGHYLRAILDEDDPLRRDEARRNFAKVIELEPGFTRARDDLERVTNGVPSQPGHGVVHVLALVGRAPFRVEVNEPVTQASLAIAQWIWTSQRRRAGIPNITAVPIPALAYHQDNPTSAFVLANGIDVGETATVTDVEATARAEFDAMRDSIVARAVLRRAFKIAITEGAKEAVSRDDKRRDGVRGEPLADIGLSIAGLLWTAFESADLRCWSLLPASFQVLRVEVPAGEHEIAVQAARNGRPTGAAQRVRVDVRDGYNTYVVALVPTLGAGPTPLTSHPAAVVLDTQAPSTTENTENHVPR